MALVSGLSQCPGVRRPRGSGWGASAGSGQRQRPGLEESGVGTVGVRGCQEVGGQRGFLGAEVCEPGVREYPGSGWINAKEVVRGTTAPEYGGLPPCIRIPGLWQLFCFQPL